MENYTMHSIALFSSTGYFERDNTSQTKIHQVINLNEMS